jgi:UDP-glucuronate decarboxylase
MKKILVTGGAGFLGSHLIDRLLDRGDQVLCTDNLYTGNIKNLDHHDGNSDFQFLEHDVIDPLDVEVDEIYNLACPASPVHYQSDPINTTKTNVIGALNMLELAKRNNAKIFQASTSEVYGDPTVHPQVESYWGNVNPVGVRSCYDEGKRCAETLFFDYYRQYNIKIRVGRIFNTYGPRMQLNDGRVVSNFIIQALRGEDLTLYGDGSQTRSFCYVDDLIEGFIRFMDIDNNKGTGSSFTGPINLGNPIEFTVLELAEKILTIVGGESKLSFQPLPSDDPTQRKPDIDIANKYLENWNPKVSLELGLTKTVEYFDNLLKKD